MPNDSDDDLPLGTSVTPNESSEKGSGYGGGDQQAGMADVMREPGEIPTERKELVKKLTKECRQARKFWEEDFKRMKKDEDMLLGLQWEGQGKLEDNRYVVNVIQRHVQQRTAAIYAKNPTVVARRKEMMDFKLWDENQASFQMAQQTLQAATAVMQGAQAGNPQAQGAAVQAAQNPEMMKAVLQAEALIADINEGAARKAMKNRICKTMELYFKNKVLSQQNPPFKAMMKQLVRRTLAAGVGYTKLGLVREMQEHVLSPDELKGMATMTERMSRIEMLMADLIDDPAAMEGCASEKEELRLAMEAMRSKPNDVVQEGIVFDFPGATSIIPDWRMVHLQGFVGCDFVSEEYLFSIDEIQTIWKVDVSGKCSLYNADNVVMSQPQDGGTDSGYGNDPKKGRACVWVRYDRPTGLMYTICDGFPNFLEEPKAPPLVLERFFPWYPLAFNLIEHHKQRFPLSDCFLMRHEQRDMNRAREGLRQHRIANRPLTAVANGMLSDDDVKKLETRPANGVVQLNALTPGAKIDDVLQVVKHPPINADLYDVTPQFEDILRTVGTQEANLGGTSSATATESSIAESSRMSALQSNMDDLDDLLTEVMRDAGKVALVEIGAEEVTRVVGVGAVWPTLSSQDVADEIFLEIVAGSSGRPNKAVEVQNFTQAAPFLLQIPGLSPEWLGKQLLMRMDDRLDLTDAFIAGQPSIQTMNALQAKPLGAGPAGPGAEDPNAQGPEGAGNSPQGADAGGALGPQPQGFGGPAAPPVMQ